jgi:hypothetical protein
MLTFAVLIVMQWLGAVCTTVVSFLKHLIHFVTDTKTVDTCFYSSMVSGIFDLAKIAFFIRGKLHFVSLLHSF